MFSRKSRYAIIPLRRVSKGNTGGDFMRTIKKILVIGGMAGLLMSTLFINKVEVAATPTTTTSRDTTSADNSLKSLQLSEGTLSPNFKYNVVKYAATVGSDVASIKVNAQVSNVNAKILSITGADQLKVGKNTIKITVEAGNGSLALYIIEVTKQDAPATAPETPTTPTAPDDPANIPTAPNNGPTFEFDGKQYQVVNNHDSADLPDGFKQLNVKIKDQDCVVYRYKESEIVLVYFVNATDDQDAGYYVFDLKKDIPCFELGSVPAKSQAVDSDETTEGIDQAAAYQSLQKNYNALYDKYKKETEQSRKIIYIGIVALALLFIVLINVIIMERMKRRADDSGDEYLSACASNSEHDEEIQSGKEINKKMNKQSFEQSNTKKDEEIEFIDFDDL